MKEITLTELAGNIRPKNLYGMVYWKDGREHVTIIRGYSEVEARMEFLNNNPTAVIDRMWLDLVNV